MATPFSNLWRKIEHFISNLGNHEALGKLGDFTTNPCVIVISGMAIGIGVISAFVALILLRLIGLFTNLFFSDREGHPAWLSSESRVCR